MAAQGVVRAVAGLLAVLVLTAATWGSWKEFRGTVVDAETGGPIPGAVVVVEWVKRHRLGMDGPEYVQNVQEVVTDAEGRFSVQPSPGINLNPITYLYRVTMVIFAPGYEPADPVFMMIKGAESHMSESSIQNLAALEMGGAIRLKSSSKMRDVLSINVLADPRDARNRVPNLWRAINEQRRRLGLGELSLPN